MQEKKRAAVQDLRRIATLFPNLSVPSDDALTKLQSWTVKGKPDTAQGNIAILPRPQFREFQS